MKKRPHVWVIESWQRSGYLQQGDWHWDVADYSVRGWHSKKLAQEDLRKTWGNLADRRGQFRIRKYVREKP